MSNSFIVPEKIYKKYIPRLLIEYKNEDGFLYNILKNIQKNDIEIDTDTGSKTRTDYNGQYYEEECFYHTLTFYLPKECFNKNGISIKNQHTICEKIREDLNIIITKSNESIIEIKLELKDEVADYLKNKIKSTNTNIKDSTLWEPDCLRVFISHSSKDFGIAKKLKDHLIYDGISCFVAHKDISPTREWKEEIKKVLSSMEVMFVLVTEDSNQSDWVDQEIGYALGQNIPIIPIKLDKSDPKAFISDIQALTLNRDHIVSDKIDDTIKKIVECIKNKLPEHPYLLKRFFNTRNYGYRNAKESFMDIIDLKLNDEEIEKIVSEITDETKRKGNFGGTNQLKAILMDPFLKEEHIKKVPKKYKYYAELLRDKILSQHTKKRYSIKKLPEKEKKSIDDVFKIIDNYQQDKNNQKQNINKFEDLPF